MTNARAAARQRAGGWRRRRLRGWHTVQVVFEGLDPDTGTFSLSAPTARRIGGRVEPRGLQTLALRVILDCSLLEVFAGSGQVITTRVYRGTPPSKKDPGVDLLSIGGTSSVARLSAWELSSIWGSPQVCPCCPLRSRRCPAAARLTAGHACARPQHVRSQAYTPHTCAPPCAGHQALQGRRPLRYDRQV
jgi:hypothetical protein